MNFKTDTWTFPVFLLRRVLGTNLYEAESRNSHSRLRKAHCPGNGSVRPEYHRVRPSRVVLTREITPDGVRIPMELKSGRGDVSRAQVLHW